MNLIACTIFFNDTPDLFERLLISIRDTVDKIVCVDGAYKEFSHNKPYSTDGCLDIAKAYSDEIIECKEAWKDQPTKRNMYFTSKSENDYYFIIDTDEYLDGQIDKSSLKEDVYKMKNIMHQGGVELPSQNNRIFRNVPGIHYNKKHNVIKDGQGKILNIPIHDKPLCESAKIIHTPELRGTRRLGLDGEYMRTRNENNIPIPVNTFISNEITPIGLRFKATGIIKKFTGNDPVTNKDIIAEKDDVVFMSKESSEILMNHYQGQWEYA